ncbi:MAG: hypothetical protein AAGI38_05580 [Bacteroidota bacterium]
MKYYTDHTCHKDRMPRHLQHVVREIMLMVLLILILASSMGCEKIKQQAGYMILNNQSRYAVNFMGETWKQSFNVTYDDAGNKLAEGHYAVTRDGQTGSLKVGEWTEYYPISGQIKSKGNYKISSYPSCGMTPYIQHYNYKAGHWEYYDGNGSEKASGVYQLKKFELHNNCSGGTKIQFGVIGQNWRMNDSLKNSIHEWDVLKEFQLVPQGNSSIGVNENGELVRE